MPWDPTRDLLTMQERLESLFGQAHPGWVPAADLCELTDRYVLTVEVPGLLRSDVQVDYRDNSLVVRGQRPSPGCCPERYHQLERGHGRFSRAFRFSHPIDGEGVTADLVDGILTVIVPKADAGSRTLDIE
jgi:HSP20 family protein